VRHGQSSLVILRDSTKILQYDCSSLGERDVRPRDDEASDENGTALESAHVGCIHGLSSTMLIVATVDTSKRAEVEQEGILKYAVATMARLV
jgi:hypothetical protein